MSEKVIRGCQTGGAAHAKQRVERLAELGTLTGHLAHEIRNPLSTVKINLQLLAEDIASMVRDEEGVVDVEVTPMEEERIKSYRRQLRRLETITKETDRLTETLNDFLSYAGRMEIPPVQCDVNELLDDLIDFYEPQAVSQGVQIRYTCGKESLSCRLDVDLFKQALLNLFINATQAMHDGGELIVRSTLEGDSVRIDVIDTGPGIPFADQAKVFDPYYTTRSGGTGLGLPTCRRVIEEHRGDIKVVSEEGKGSNFVITVPLLKG